MLLPELWVGRAQQCNKTHLSSNQLGRVDSNSVMDELGHKRLGQVLWDGWLFFFFLFFQEGDQAG